MAESIHAVVSNKQKNPSNLPSNYQQSNDNNSQNIQITQNMDNQNIVNNNIKNNGDDDDDDDIDIIGRSVNPSIYVPFSFVNLPSASSHTDNNTISNLTITEPPSDLSLWNQKNLVDAILLAQNSHLQTTSSLEMPDCSLSNKGQQTQNDKNKESSEWMTDEHFIESRNKLRKKLRYHFMSPFDKWKMKGRFPWKLLFQIIKIILVTTQVILFGNSFTSIRSVDNSMLMTLHDLFLLHWDSSRDFKSIPPNIGPYAVYTKSDIYRHIDYAIQNYANISNLTFGSFGYQLKRSNSYHISLNESIEQDLKPEMSPITICFRRYANVTLNPSYSEYYIDLNIEEKCFTINNLYPPGSQQWLEFSFYKYLMENAPNQTDFYSLIQLSLKLPLRVMVFNTLAAYNIPQCFNLDLVIHFNNKLHTGEIEISMAFNKFPISCVGNQKQYYNQNDMHVGNIIIIINFTVLFLCSVSLVLCVRTIYKARSLQMETSRFFMNAFKRSLDAQSSLHFIDGWILMILLNDVLLLIGTIINLLRVFNFVGPHKISYNYPFQLDSFCSAFLGIGLLLVWFGILRYLAFFDQYNILLVTLKHSISRISRFILCVLVLYGGFCFSGWIILGPYHFKFYTLARTSECLFALMNGDDVFATFAYLESSSPFVWWFSRIYLYSYVLLFIYAVLSLFIAILMDSYETIKEYYSMANKNQNNIRIDFAWSNDQLSRFLLTKFDHENSDEDFNLVNNDQQQFEEQESMNDRQCYSCDNCFSCLSRCFRNFHLWIRQYFVRNSTILTENENQPLENEAIN